MTSLEALERIKSKYKGCLVKEAHNLPFSSDINIENIEEYWHIENKNDFSQIEKDLEILDILKNESDSKRIIKRDGIVSFHLDMILTTDNYNKIKEWLDE